MNKNFSVAVYMKFCLIRSYDSGEFDGDNEFWVLTSASRYSEKSPSETADSEG